MTSHMTSSSNSSSFASMRHHTIAGMHCNTLCDTLGCVFARAQAS